MNLTVACVLVKGHVGFTPEYVVRLKRMVERHLWGTYKFVCLTDQPDRLPPGINTQVVHPPLGVFAWWTKIELFKPGRFNTARIMYLDLDVLAVDDLEDVINYPAPFALIPTEGDWQGKGKLKVVKRFNSSCMVFDNGAVDSLYTHWDPSVTGRLWGDQDWIGERMPEARTMPLPWFPRLASFQRNGHEPRWPNGSKVILCKKPKPHIAAQHWPWFAKAWG